LLSIPAGAYLFFIVGAVATIGSELMIHATGTEKFWATACHFMEAFTMPECLDSPHSSNTSGVRATCSDCHIPHTYPEKLFVKARSGFKDIYHELLGTIGTRENYEANRARMAEEVWAYMEKIDFRECRNCHYEDYFLLV